MKSEDINIVFIGGCGVGKTTTIQKLWGKNIDNNQIISENIKGRGVMTFNVIETDSILFSISENWSENKNNIGYLQNANTIVMVLPAVAYGYQEELLFLESLYTAGYINSTSNIVFAVSKVDEVYKCSNKIYDTIEQVLSIEKLVYKTAEVYLQRAINLENVICYSSIKGCNIELLKERIWDNIIKSTNNIIFKDNLPTLVVSGKRGCGKSSTLNSLFNLDLPTNMATACTKYPRVMNINLSIDGQDFSFNLVDLPGIAESLSADIDYAHYYEEYLSKATVLLCLSQADTRAYMQDEMFYKRLLDNKYLIEKTSVLIGINQIDLLYKTVESPDGIDLFTLSPDDKLLRDKINDIYDNAYKSIFKENVIDKKFSVHPFSAYMNWNIEELKIKIINLMTKKKMYGNLETKNEYSFGNWS